MAPDLNTVLQEMAGLHGQIDGALETLKLGMALLGVLISALVGVCVWVFVSLEKSHQQLVKTVDKTGNRVTALETWRKEHSRAG